MTIPDGQIWMLHHVGTAYYWTRWLDAPLRDDRVVVMGLPCRVVAVVDDACGESKVFVERVLVDGVECVVREVQMSLSRDQSEARFEAWRVQV